MDTITDAVFTSWDFNPWLLTPALVTGVLYARGWRRLYKRAPHRFGFTQLTSFYAGLITILFALMSPLDAFAGWLLTVHMIQHLLLMMVAPPLLLYGAPYLPLLFGLPRDFLRDGVQPFLASPTLRKVGHFIVHPVFSLSAFVFTNTAWHLPAMYELALRSPTWHQVEHVCFLTTALLFWWPIIQPYPCVARTQRWLIVPYLFLADIQNTALSDLPDCPAYYDSHSARRSGSRRRHHVGRRFHLLSGSGRPNYHATAQYAAKGSFKKPQRPVTTFCISA